MGYIVKDLAQLLMESTSKHRTVLNHMGNWDQWKIIEKKDGIHKVIFWKDNFELDHRTY